MDREIFDKKLKLRMENHEELIKRKNKKLEAFPSHTVIADMDDLKREHIIKVAREMNVKTILATRVVSVDEKDVTFKKGVSYDTYMTENGPVMMPYIDNETRVDKQVQVRLETGLYELASEKQLWAATSEIMDPESVETAIDDFCETILQQLKTDGHIR
jgi:hypothetical protein